MKQSQPVTQVSLTNPLRISFCISAAFAAAAVGLPNWLIKVLGRWSSDCNQLYICTPQNVYCLLRHTWATFFLLNLALLFVWGGYLLHKYQCQLSLAAISPSFVFANLVVQFNTLLCLFLSNPACAGGVSS